MNINDLYAFMPEDLHGSIAVSQGAVTITQDDGQPPFVLYKASQGDNPDLVLNQSDVPRPAGMWDPPPTLVPQAPLDEDVNYYIEQEQAISTAGGLVSAPTPPPAPPTITAPVPEPKLSFFQSLTNFFTRSS